MQSLQNHYNSIKSPLMTFGKHYLSYSRKKNKYLSLYHVDYILTDLSHFAERLTHL